MKQLRFIITVIIFVPLLLSAQNSSQQAPPPIPLTDGTTYLMAPEWSPDGNTIAATSTNYRGIYLVSYPNGEVTQLSDRAAAGFGMQWSHSGEQIATIIAQFRENRRFNALMSIDVLSGNETQLSDFQSLFPGSPEWTANDQYIYLKGTDQFKVYNVQTHQRVQSPSANFTSPSVVYSRNGKLRLRNIVNQTEQLIEPVQGEVLNLRISPDQTKIAFEIIGGNLWVANADGSNPVDLGRGNRPSWSPSSDKITYMITKDDGHSFTAADVYVINVDGSKKTNITDSQNTLEMYPSWSPDGNWIAYSTLSDGKIVIQETE